MWRDSFGHTGAGLAADGDNNGLIDADDYEVWKSNFGYHSGSDASANSAVPEPATLVMMIVGAAGFCLKRRRKNQTESKTNKGPLFQQARPLFDASRERTSLRTLPSEATDS